MDLLEDGVAPPERRSVATIVVVTLVVGLVVGALLGRLWTQREQEASGAAAVRLAAVLEFARVQIDPVHAGEDVKLVGQLINVGPGTLDVAAGSSPSSLVLGASALAPGAATSFTAEEPLVCQGSAVSQTPLLRVRATSKDGTTTVVALPLDGEAWESLRLECLQRRG